VPTAGQALVHVLALACLRGVAVRGPLRGAEQAFALRRDWLGEPPAVDRDATLAELARRYLAGHGPASERDLARWSGLPLGDARSGLAAIAGEIDDAGGGLVDLAGRPAPADAPPRLLGAFEPLLLGWESRDDVVGDNGAALISGGVFRPFALVNGRAAARWRLANGKVELQPFGSLSGADAAALGADAADVERFLTAAR
jgi:winged helix DNA-binding protein